MILTESVIRNAAREAEHRGIPINESVMHFDAMQSYDLFISHSFGDKELVKGLYLLFEKAGYYVYIDWIADKNLNRKSVTTDTANLIKERIRASMGTAYVSTENSTSSKWCPWELGVSDGLKGKVCILPVMDSSFKGQEYLGLYPYLEYARSNGRDKYEFWVYDQEDNRKYIILRDWLRGKKPYFHD